MYYIEIDQKNIVISFVETNDESYLDYIKITEEQAERIKTSDKVFEYENKQLKELTAEQSKGYAPLFPNETDREKEKTEKELIVELREEQKKENLLLLRTLLEAVEEITSSKVEGGTE